MVLDCSLYLKAPLTGYCLPLSDVPDQVFAQKALGDGISIDPTSERLVAPCEGEIVHIHSAGHALTLKSLQGPQILIHIGLDTVALKGQGFTAKVKAGDKVKTGDLLIEFNADFLATRAKSLLTEIVVLSEEGQEYSLNAHYGNVCAAQDVVLEIKLSAPPLAPTPHLNSHLTASAQVTIGDPTGLHARPAAVIANTAKQFNSTIELRRGSDKANARSVISIMKLELAYQDKVTLVAQGEDAQKAIDALKPLLENDNKKTFNSEKETQKTPPLGVHKNEKIQSSSLDVPTSSSSKTQSQKHTFNGVSVSPGLAIGVIYQSKQAEEVVHKETQHSPDHEKKALESAIIQAKSTLKELQQRMSKEVDPAHAAIFAAHQELLDDPELRERADALILSGTSAAYAWHQAYTAQAAELSHLKNEMFAARAHDLLDVGKRVLLILSPVSNQTAHEMPQNAIVVTEELAPSDIANLDRSKVIGLCTTSGGGASSHVAILARSIGIACVTSLDRTVLDIPNGTPVILDGNKGTVRVSPVESEIAEAQKLQHKWQLQQNIEKEAASAPATTTDGTHIHVAANINNPDDTKQAVALGGEGVGLLRSEFLFLDRNEAPSEEEQTAVYERIARELGSHPLIVRTLDVGGDKPLIYLPLPAEENPFLGERGIRVSLNRPEMFRAQLRAILQASKRGNVSVMFPMITFLSELREAKEILEDERKKLGIPPIPVGIMIEVPSAALMAEQFAKEADFFSIGSNDLTQYTLAIDRGNPVLAAQADGLNPAVLSLISQTVQGALAHGKWTGVCGGIASDPTAVPLLIGLGVSELSVSVPSLPSIKAQIRKLSMEQCKSLAQRALKLETAAEVRALVSKELSIS